MAIEIQDEGKDDYKLNEEVVVNLKKEIVLKF